jgi:hypothetical protein
MTKNTQTLTKFQSEVNDLLNQFSEANKQFFRYEVGHSNEVDDKWFDGDELEALSNLRTNGLNWSKVKSHGGGEGDGEECWTVYKFYDDSGDEAYVKFDGYYQSYSGSDYIEFFIVEPAQRMVTFYEAI